MNAMYSVIICCYIHVQTYAALPQDLRMFSAEFPLEIDTCFLESKSQVSRTNCSEIPVFIEHQNRQICVRARLQETF